MGRFSGAVDDPWHVRESEYPTDGMPEEQFRYLLNYAVLAPSSHNSQPWLFRLGGEEVALLADRRRALPVSDPDDRELIMSCGAALLHLRTAMEFFGRRPVVRTFPDLRSPDLLAWVRTGSRTVAGGDVRRSFHAISVRRTVRTAFEEREVPQDVREALVSAAHLEGTSLRLFAGADQRNDLADLIAEADRRQGADRSFRRELAAWMHPNRSRSRDGIPGYGLGMGEVMSIAGPLVVRTFDWGPGRAARDRELAEGSPLLAVLSTGADHPSSWLQAGQGLARTLLVAASYGVFASFLNQPIEIPEMRPLVARITGDGEHPQLILRLGYASGGRPTPRRSVMEVLDRP